MFPTVRENLIDSFGHVFTQTQQQWLGVQSCLLPRGLPRILLLCVLRGRNGEVELDSSVQFTCSVMSDSLQPHGFPVHHQFPAPTQTLSIESVMLSNHLTSCHPLLLLPSVFPSIRVFSNESVLHIRWPEYWSFSFSISPSNEYSELISFRIDWLDLLAVQGTLQSLLQHHSSKASILWRSAFFTA